MGLFQDSDCAGDLEDSKSTSGGIMKIFGSRTFVPIGSMCKKQTSVSCSTTESKMISLDVGLRLDGIPALDLWDVVIEVWHSSNDVPPVQNIFASKSKPQGAARNCRHNTQNTRLKKEGDRNVDQLSNQDYVTTNAHSSVQKLNRPFFEDNELVIKMIIKGTSSMMRHVSRSHRVALDWLFDRINLDSKIQIKYVDTKNLLENSRKEDGRRTCGSKAEVSVFDSSKLEQRAIFFLWSGCFQNPRESADGFRVCLRSRGKLQAKECRSSRGKLQAGHCPKQSPKPRNIFSNVERRQPVRTCGKLQHCVHDHVTHDGRSCGKLQHCAHNHAPRLVLKSAWNEQQQQQQLRQDVFESKEPRETAGRQYTMFRKKKARFKSIFEFLEYQDDIYKDEERMTEMQNLVDRLQDGYRDKSIIKDLKQEGVTNVFSIESKRNLKEMGNIELYERSETVRTTQCLNCF